MKSADITAAWVGGAGNFFLRCEFTVRPGDRAVLAVAADPPSYLLDKLAENNQTPNWMLAGCLIKYRLFLNGEMLVVGPPRPVRDDAPVLQYITLPADRLRTGQNVVGLLCRGEKLGVAAELTSGSDIRATGTAAWRIWRGEEAISPYDWSDPGCSSAGTRFGPGPGEYAEFLDGDRYPFHWSEPGFDASEWIVPEGVRVRFDYEISPLQPIPVTPHAPATLRWLAPDRVVLDFGSEFFGALEVSAPDRAMIEVRLGEELKPDGGVRYWLRTGNIYQERRRFPAGGGVLCGFGLRAFRYAELTGVDPEFDGSRVRLLESVYPFDGQAAEFHAAEPKLEQLWNFCKNSIRRTNFDVYFDCPTRERIAYEADALVTMKTDLVFQPNYAFARRAIRYQMNHYTWPCEWRQLMPEVFYQYVMQTGDLELVTEYYDRLVNECSFIDRFEGGLIRDWPMRVIVDWPFPCRDGYEFGPGEAVPNAHACNGWKRLAELGRLIGRHDDATRFEAAAAALTADFNARLFDSERGVYRDSLDSRHAALHSTLFPLAFGLVPGEYRESCADFIVSRGPVCSVYVAQFLLETLFDCNRADVAVALMLADGERSWFGMMNRGATICTEAWNPEEKSNMSFAHPWASSPANVLVSRWFGLRPTRPGWAEFSFAPNPGGVASGRLEITTPRGRLRAEFSPEGATAALVTESPDRLG